MNLFFRSTTLLLSLVIVSQVILSENTVLTATQFVPPTLILPKDGETNSSIPVVLKWYTSPGAISYKLELLDNKGEQIYFGEIEITTEQNQGKQIATALLNEEIVEYYGIYYWRILAIIAEGESIWSDLWSFAIQNNPWQIERDDDDDGIPNCIENYVFHTNPTIKTLFIRPMQETNRGMIYWEDFSTLLFPDPNGRQGFADIPALSNAGIEVVVIGCPGSSIGSVTNCHTYKPFDDFDYDPVSNQLPCDILEIVRKKETNIVGEGVYCYCSNKTINGGRVKGHTYFDISNTTIQNGSIISVPVWSWDIKGYTPWSNTNDGYYIPWIFPFPLNNYFMEGAYNKIDVNETSIGVNCNQVNCNSKSPMNVNDNDPVPNPPWDSDPDLTVEFNIASFQSQPPNLAGTILSFEPSEGKNDLKKVLRRTITHEIGHALLGPDLDGGSEHCSNPNCIMFQFTLDWEMRDFGGINSLSTQGANSPTGCEHSEGGRLDIRKSGIVHNHIHTN